ncbi:radical SAM protein, partial [Candidatus Dojkabacteria bacterium]|nr:radical SAM protein [Candidatus Dojkabacteria bacterium]
AENYCELQSTSDQRGGKLITLLGQNVNSWREGDRDFADLLENLCSIKGDFWINFLSSNPMDFSDKLINVIGDRPEIMKWVNLAVQSGSDRILKLMNRKYTVDDFKEIALKLRERVPNFRLTTDIIVGFPGETDRDFNKSLMLVKDMELEMVYVGKYSPRPGTLSAKSLKDNIPLEVKEGREEMLKKAVNEIRRKKHKSLIGAQMKVLVTSPSHAVSYYNHDIKFQKPVDKGKVGKFVKDEIIDSTVSGLKSVILS